MGIDDAGDCGPGSAFADVRETMFRSMRWIAIWSGRWMMFRQTVFGVAGRASTWSCRCGLSPAAGEAQGGPCTDGKHLWDALGLVTQTKLSEVPGQARDSGGDRRRGTKRARTGRTT